MINPRFQMYSTPRVEKQLQLVNYLLDIYRKVYRLRCIPFIKYINDVHNGFCYKMSTVEVDEVQYVWDSLYYIMRSTDYRSEIKGANHKYDSYWFKKGALKPRIIFLKHMQTVYQNELNDRRSNFHPNSDDPLFS